MHRHVSKINTPKVTYFLGFPPVSADERDKDASVSFVLLEAGCGAVNSSQELVAWRADRDDEPSADGELILQQPGDSGRTGGHEDAIERSGLRNAFGSVTDSNLDIGNPKLFE